jgi:hypothetical protein
MMYQKVICGRSSAKGRIIYMLGGKEKQILVLLDWESRGGIRLTGNIFSCLCLTVEL